MKSKYITAGYTLVILADVLTCLIFIFFGFHEAAVLMRVIYFIVATILLVASFVFLYFYISYRRRTSREMPKE